MKKFIPLLPAFLVLTLSAFAQDDHHEAKVAIDGKGHSQDSVLFVVDGKQWQETFIAAGASPDKEGNHPLSLDPNDIESVQVIKGDDAIRQYGQRGRNGVVIITTKAHALKKKKGRKGS